LNTARRLPAEWEAQDAILLVWPQPHPGWDAVFPEVVTAYLNLIKTIRRFEPVILIAPDLQTAEQVKQQTAPSPFSLTTYVAASNDCWARDFAPITVYENDRPRLINFKFNGWGGKFLAELDNQLTLSLSKQGVFNNTPLENHDWILEGGSIDSDGQGILLTTSRCLLSDSRNPGVTKEQTEKLLHETLGIHTVHWLEYGWLEGDDTDGHTDMLARFCNPDTIAYVQCKDKNDPHYEPLHQMEHELKKISRANGMPYHLLPLPLPSACCNQKAERLPASYVNFLIINNAVLVPVYQQPEDKIALKQFEKIFPDREIIAVDAQPFIHESGSVHCLSMQIPKGVISS